MSTVGTVQHQIVPEAQKLTSTPKTLHLMQKPTHSFAIHRDTIEGG